MHGDVTGMVNLGVSQSSFISVLDWLTSSNYTSYLILIYFEIFDNGYYDICILTVIYPHSCAIVSIGSTIQESAPIIAFSQL